MNYLVTGGAGFIGSHLLERLLEDDHTVVCLDNFNDYYNPQIKRRNIQDVAASSRLRLVKGDILDTRLLEDLFQASKFDMVVHLAAMAGVRPSILRPRLYEEVNVRGTMNLLEAMRAADVKKMVFGSTSSIYGAAKKVPFSESDPVDNPISPYAATKKAAELICYTYSHLYEFSINCLRFFTVYGPRQRPDMAIHKFTRLVLEGRPIPVFGDGQSRRDYTYVSDIVHGILRAMDRCEGYEIYNLGESRTISLIGMIETIEKCTGRTAQKEVLPMQAGDVPITYADISKARRDLGYDPQFDVEEGISRFVQWYKQTMLA